MSGRARARRRLLVPEVVQTSVMDCGPAALKCLLEGFGVPVSFGRLREACQTNVDGTSIDALEDVANQLGLEAEQMIVPMDHLLRPETGSLPAIVVLRLPSGQVHFVVAWAVHGPLVQVMDPSAGRRWLTRDRFLTEVYAHSAVVPAEVWREWACADDFRQPLARRLCGLGPKLVDGEAHVRRAVDAGGWRELAALDAATRLLESMVRSGSIRPGPQAARLLDHLLERCRGAEPGADSIVTPPYWTVLPAPPAADGGEQLHLRGAVLVRALGLRSGAPSAEAPGGLSQELAAALAEPPPRPARALLGLVRAGGPWAPLAVLAALALIALGTGLEALLFRGLLEVGARLGLVQQRLGAIAVLAVTLLGMLLLEVAAGVGLFRLGRQLDTRFRLLFLRKLPLLSDRYFQSRPTSDMAERSHSIYMLHLTLRLWGQMVRSGLEVLVSAAGIVLLYPGGALPAALLAGAMMLIPLASQPALVERDLRVRTHAGALARYYLDALLGLTAVRAYGAERSVKHEHESLLVEWTRAGRLLNRAAILFEGWQSVVALGLLVWLLWGYVVEAGGSAGALLLAFWGFKLFTAGREIALGARQYPSYRNIALRLLEPLGAPGGDAAPAGGPAAGASGEGAGARPGMALALSGVRVVAAGHLVLDEVSLEVPPGQHLAIVGPSGAGKSSLVGLFLGWHRPAAGAVAVDGRALDEAHLERVRRETSWVDPAVQLWNRTLLDNLRYGRAAGAPLGTGTVLADADLFGVLESLPAGLQTVLGEGGGLVSGGEGQRVRLGRAMLQPESRLVVLDEAFRGLDRSKRRELLARVRRSWSRATLLCVTHDVGDTAGFERVIVVEGGRVVEDGAPAALAARPGSRYRALLDAEEAVRAEIWQGGQWRRLTMQKGSGVES